MGTDRSNGDLRGIVVPDPRINLENLVSKTDATVPSAYTQASPFTGPPAPDQDTNLVLRTSGLQSDGGDLEIRTQRSGGAGLESAGYVWRDVAAGDTDTEYKGWDAPAIITGWEPLLFTDIDEGAEIRPHAIRLLSGKLLALYSVTPVGVVRIRRYDPAHSSWTNVDLGPTGAGTGYTTGAASLCQLSSGRVLCFVLANDQQQVDVYFSDDDGDNWKPGGYRVVDHGLTEATVYEMRVAFSPETSDLVLFLMWEDTHNSVNTATQYASADLGATFYQVVEDWHGATNEEIETLDIVPMVGGGFCVLYIDEQTASNKLLRRRLGSAFVRVDAVTAEQPDNNIRALDDVTGWSSEDGVMWLIVGDGSSAAESRLGAVYRSVDQGDTWEVAADGQGSHALQTGTSTTSRFVRYSAASVSGRTALVSRWVGPDEDYARKSVGVLWYGGYGNHTAPAATAGQTTLGNQDYKDTHYIMWGHQRTITNPGGIYLPVQPPSDVDWTGHGAGSEGFNSAGSWEISTGIGQTKYYERTETDDQVSAVFLDFEVEVDNFHGSTTAEEITMTVRLADGNYQYEVQVRCSHAGYQIYDVNAGADVDGVQSYDLTSKAHIRLAMDERGNVKTWHSRDGHVRAWDEGSTGTGLTDGGAGAQNLVRWGHTGPSFSVSRWTMVGYCFWPGKWSGTQTARGYAETWSNPADLHPKSYPVVGPEHIYDGVEIQAVAGPSWFAETQRITPAYEYPIRAMFPDEAPSPQRRWRSSVDDVDVSLVWDLEREVGFNDSFWESSSIGCFLVNTNVRQAKFQGWNGSAWEDIISLDPSAGYSQLPYRRKGRMIFPDTTGSAPSGERWSPHQMHAGDQIVLDDGENQPIRRIVSNAEGGWRAGTKLARLALDPKELDGGEADHGNATIYRKNYGGVTHNVHEYYRYVRLFINRHQTVDGYYAIGSLAIGPAFIFGLQYGNGYSWERTSNVEIDTRDSGVRSSRVKGPQRRAVELSWSGQAQDTTRMWDSEPSPDYVTGVNSGDPVASLADTCYQLMGLLDRTDGADPVVYLGRISRGTEGHDYAIDPEWMYGRMIKDTVSMDHVIGDDAVSPVYRGNVLRIEEEV